MTDEAAKPGSKRRYRKRKRADDEVRTRLRITEAAVRLHETIGPARTTMSAVAEEAGVQRSTVYRHFAGEEELFGACSAHWLSLNPPPSPEPWAEIRDPGERLDRALTELYDWYAWAEPMLANTMRDASLVPAMRGPTEAAAELWSRMHKVLMRRRPERGRRRLLVAAAIRLAIDFGTWCLLTRGGKLGRDDFVALTKEAVDVAGKIE